ELSMEKLVTPVEVTNHNFFALISAVFVSPKGFHFFNLFFITSHCVYFIYLRTYLLLHKQ
ncbi:MAG: hypothetical protein COZ75_07735, partial [Flavobacteriaceae bacterium CG_4_8_14_3_um_filter_34_10]